MSEYRAIREKTTFLELCKNPALCAEVMITAVNRLNVDAAIIFSDLLPILEPMGLELEFTAGDGPAIHNPLREARDLERFRELESVEPLSFVTETVALTRAGLPEQIPVIGFAGAPFTLASYAIEGGGSRNYLHTKALMYRDAGVWNEIMARLARAVTRYLNAQIAAGAQAVQLFDSWVGCLGPDDYRRFVLPHTKAIIDGLPPGVPVIHFAAGNPALLPLAAEAGGGVMGIDWRMALDDAWRAVGHDRAVQGNLDPAVLLSDREQIRRHAQEMLARAAGRPGTHLQPGARRAATNAGRQRAVPDRNGARANGLVSRPAIQSLNLDAATCREIWPGTMPPGRLPKSVIVPGSGTIWAFLEKHNFGYRHQRNKGYRLVHAAEVDHVSAITQVWKPGTSGPKIWLLRR